jgi:tRNA-dihydrouridine synthase
MARFPFPLDAAVPLYLARWRACRSRPSGGSAAAGADVVVTEFLSAEGIRRENPATIDKLRFGPDERPIGVQIFGADAAAMGEAAAFVTDVFQPEFIDINFGCPVKKVVRRNGGSGCLKDLNLVQDVIRAVARSDARHVQDLWLERGAARSGGHRTTLSGRARVLALHPRGQMYTGNALEEIAAVAGALDIPVLGNGDIKRGRGAHASQTGCAGVIARGSFGQPWIFDQTHDLLEGGRCDRRRGRGAFRDRTRSHAWPPTTSPTAEAPRSSFASTSAGT